VTERLNRFVDRKAGSIGRNLEQDAARLVEIDLPSSVAAVFCSCRDASAQERSPPR